MAFSQMQSNFFVKVHQVISLNGSISSSISIRSISTTRPFLVNRRAKTRTENRNRPFHDKDKARDELTAKAVHWKEKEGFKLLQNALAKHTTHPPGKVNLATNKFNLIPEMVPEFIVPDLTDFKLKPYISYRSEPIQQEKITARKLFNICYADKIKEINEKKAKSQETPSQNENPIVK